MAANRTIRWKFGADSTQFKQELGKIQKATQATAKGVNSALGAIGVGFSVAAITSQIDRVIDKFARLQDTANKLDLQVEQLQELRFMMEEVGGTSSQLDMAIQRFSRRLAEAANGTGELLPILEKYGIAVKDAEGRTRDSADVLADLADATKNASSSNEQLLIAFKAFDSEGVQFVEVLRGGSEGMDAMAQKAHELGLVLDQETSEELAEARRTLDRFGEQTDIATAKLIRIGEAALNLDFRPWIDQLKKDYAAKFDFIDKLTGGHLGKMKNKFVDFFTFVKDGFIELHKPAVTLYEKIFGKAEESAEEATEAIQETIDTSDEALNDMADSGDAVEAAFDDASSAVNKTKSEVISLKNEVDKAIKAAQGLVDQFDGPTGTSSNTINGKSLSKGSTLVTPDGRVIQLNSDSPTPSPTPGPADNRPATPGDVDAALNDFFGDIDNPQPTPNPYAPVAPNGEVPGPSSPESSASSKQAGSLVELIVGRQNLSRLTTSELISLAQQVEDAHNRFKRANEGLPGGSFDLVGVERRTRQRELNRIMDELAIRTRLSDPTNPSLANPFKAQNMLDPSKGVEEIFRRLDRVEDNRNRSNGAGGPANPTVLSDAIQENSQLLRQLITESNETQRLLRAGSPNNALAATATRT